jgi:hypothetical protein
MKLPLTISVGLSLIVIAVPVDAVNQTLPGAGNSAAAALARKSPLVQSAYNFLIGRAQQIHNTSVRSATVDAISNPNTCVTHRANLTPAARASILQQLSSAGLVDPADNATFPGGLIAGVFPPLPDDGTKCPKLPMPFFASPGSLFHGHHSYPGGLAIHETFNDISDTALADDYRQVFGYSNQSGMPVIGPAANGSPSTHSKRDRQPEIWIDQDTIIAAPIWHDWAKPIVFQWNADGSEFQELNFGGNGTNDSFGGPGNSKTGAHHIIGLAEAMKRRMPPDLVITQACAHSAPTLGNEYKVVNWIRAAAIMAQIDPVAAGYLYKDSSGKLRLPPLRKLGDLDLTGKTPTQTNLLVEYTLHNLSDADYTFSIPAVTTVEVILQSVAPGFGFNPSDANYNNAFRNPVLSYLGAERLMIEYSNGGLDTVKAEIQKLRSAKII